MAYDVFISHSSKDKLAADAVCHALEQNGVRCWIAPRDVRPGKTFAAEIIGAIKACAVFLLVFSKSSNASEDVANETHNACKRGKNIIPYRLDNTEMSDEMEYFLSRKHWIDANPGDTVFAALVNAVRDALGMETQVGTPVVADDRVYVENKRYDNGYYTGYMVNGKRNGQGNYTYSYGEKYVGEYKDDKRNGQGTNIFPSGDKHVGEYKDGKRNGQGVYAFSSGEKYMGEFKDDKYNGQGTFYYADGSIMQQGQWKDDIFIG